MILSDILQNNEMLKITDEFRRIQGKVYLDNGGTALYPKRLIESVNQDLLENFYQNPHSDKLTADCIDQIRYRILGHFNTNANEYTVIFTSGCTASFKLLADTFQFKSTENEAQSGCFAYLIDNHTSVIGIREIMREKNVECQPISHNDFLITGECSDTVKNCLGIGLFVMPLQSNFNGFKYPLHKIKSVQDGCLNKTLGTSLNWFTAVDAASFCSTNHLDLQIYKPDFVCLSFYKIFGYPTGLGALLVRNTSSNVLEKKYFGGGTVEIVLNGDDFHVKKKSLHERFEDGTVSFLSILALKHCYESMEYLIPKKINNNIMETISQHTFYLAKYLFDQLQALKHANGARVVKTYCDTEFEDVATQGGIVAFNLLRANGDYIGYAEVQHMAGLFNISLRTGCHCNTGTCQRHLNLKSKTLKEMHQAGHVCGDNVDLLFGNPTGCVRVSFGYYNTRNDVELFMRMIRECFVEKETIVKSNVTRKSRILNILNENIVLNDIECYTKYDCDNTCDSTLTEINIYPIKSCGAFKIKSSWELCDRGFKYDRDWMIVNDDGVCFTQKQCAKMCLIRPIIDLKKDMIVLTYPNMKPFHQPLTQTSATKTEASICQSKVCNDNVQVHDCGDEVAEWISLCLERSFLRLVKQSYTDSRTLKNDQSRDTKLDCVAGSNRLSLNNQAQFLLVNRKTVEWLKDQIRDQCFDESVDSLIDRFRGNLIVETGIELEEREWKEVTIGGQLFKVDGPCNRCGMVCIDQSTGEKTVEPLRTISEVFSGKLKFGIYLRYCGSVVDSSTVVKCNSNLVVL